MDYDDNGFQSQNFQLVGDNNNRFPSSLRSFPLPKLDLDENFEVNLRFDSLVRTDGLLGIQGQVNDWIENFSFGNSALESYLSATEPYSTSKHDNAWSEATSSESVEILLKSIGEGEIKIGTIVNEVDAHNLQIGYKEQQNPCPKMEDIVNSGTAPPPDGCAKISLSIVDNSARDPDQFDGASQVSNGEKSGMGFDVVPLSERSQLDQASGADVCVIDRKKIASSHDASKMCPVLGEIFFEPSQKKDHIDSGVVGKIACDDRGCVAKECQEASDPDTCSAQANHSSASVSSFLSVDKSRHQMFSHNEMEKNDDMTMTGKEAPTNNDSLKNEYRNAKVNDQFSEGHIINSALCGMKTSSYLEANLDTSVLLTEGCGDPLFSGNPDGLLEAIAYPVKVWNEIGEAGDKNLTTTMEMSYLAVEGSANDEKHPVETNHEENVNCHDLPENSPKEAFYGENGLLVEDTKLVGSLGKEKKLDTTLDVTKERKSPEYSSIDSDNSHIANNCTEAGNLHSSHDQAYSEGTENKDGAKSSKTNLSDAVLLKHGSADIEKCAEDGAIEKEVIKDPRETVRLEKFSPALGNVADEDIFSSNDHGKMGRADDSLLGHMGLSGSPGSDASKELDKRKLLKVVDDSLVRDMVQNESERRGAEFPSPVSYEDEDVTISSSVHTSILRSDVEAQILPKTASGLSHMGGLPVKEIVHGVTVASFIRDCPNPATPRKANDVIQLDETSEKCSRIPKGDANSQISVTSTAVHVSGQPSAVKCENKGDTKADVAPGDGTYDQNLTHQSESNTHYHSHEATAGKSGSSAPNCSSPPVMSCIERYKDMKEQKDQKDTVGVSQPWTCSATMVGCVDSVQLVPHDSKDSMASDDHRSFTFEVGPADVLSDKSPGHFCAMQSFKLAQGPKKNLRESRFESGKAKLHGPVIKTTDKDNTWALSGCCAEQITVSSAMPTDVSRPLQAATEEKHSSRSPSIVGTISKDMESDDKRQCPPTEDNSSKVSCSPSVQASDFPDLNSAISLAALSHQPFTDLQQVQLRAQIFVYGSLIQGTPPDEACMIAAFGETDGGRSDWETVWRVAVERFQNQKPPASACETPVSSRSALKSSEQLTRCNTLESRALGPSLCQSSTKLSSLATYNSSSFPTPLWNFSPRDGLHSNMSRGTNLDFNQALSPMHSYQPLQMRQHLGNTASWFSTSAHPGSLIVPSQGSISDGTPQYSAVLATAPQATPSKELPVSRASNMPLASASVLLPSLGSSNVSVPQVAQIEAPRKAANPANNKNPSTGHKPRKRKKAAATADLVPVFPVSLPQIEPHVTVGSENRISAGLPSSVNSPIKVGTDCPLASTDQIISPTKYQIVSSGTTEQRVIFSGEMCSKIEQAKLQAEDAAALAVSTIRHSQGIWSQIALKKDSGLVSEVEEKLVSAAVASTVAAAVAKAAAAAAKVASDAALQAKTMADEAMDSVKQGHITRSSETGHDQERNLSRLSSMSILKGKEKSQGSSSAIAVAREASKRRLESTTAAAKRAENFDAIVKAAELAAEAVSQAGIIVAMGDPLPFTLRELAEAGPENYWKVHCAADEGINNTVPQNGTQELGTVVSGAQDITEKEFDVGRTTQDESLLLSDKKYTGSGLGNTSMGEPVESNLMEDVIRKDSVVEVVADEDGLRGVWFSARVLDLKDDKAYICYDNLLTDQGSDHLKEWIPLKVDGFKAPRIRIAHPTTVVKPDGGTKKRHREAINDYVWTIGDHVDAWMRDGWWEGVVTDKSKEDETKLHVHFPAGGDSSIVRAWNLRPSLVWKDGQWTRWSRHKENVLEPYEGDTPHEKRPKMISFRTNSDSDVDGQGHGKMSGNLPDDALRKPEGPLILSANERTFSVGKNVREENNPGALKSRQTVLQKEGSRVVFGVPKPGKKRKFMEVSKHYVADKTDKLSEGNNSVKFAKYLMPQASHALRNTSKVDPRGKQAVGSKPKWPRPIKSQATQTRSAAEKDNSSVSNASASSCAESVHGAFSKPRVSANDEESQLERQNMLEVGSTRTLGRTDLPLMGSSVQPAPDVPPSIEMPSSAVDTDLDAKQKITAAVEKLITSEGKGLEHPGKVMTEASELRRSNRRFQPTSRLLEGLQSSLIISKAPIVQHDRSGRALHRGGSSSKGNFLISISFFLLALLSNLFSFEFKFNFGTWNRKQSWLRVALCGAISLL
ncbi:putative Agenet-like domain-containing protein [Dioscorea sansibarensis]